MQRRRRMSQSLSCIPFPRPHSHSSLLPGARRQEAAQPHDQQSAPVRCVPKRDAQQEANPHFPRFNARTHARTRLARRYTIHRCT
jgi:hypothetical protein